MLVVSAEYNRGAGLGNKLFPWARTRILAQEKGCAFLNTRWVSPHGGGISRGGVDYRRALRKIVLVGNFKPDCEALSSWAYWLKGRRLPVVRCATLSEARAIDGDVHVVFRWDAEHNFSEFAGRQKFLRHVLRNMTVSSQQSFIDRWIGRDYIALNVRCGNDFIPAGSLSLGYVKTGIEWFAAALKTVRMKYGNLPAVVVSDGGAKQLQQLLRLEDVRLLDAPSAIADLGVMMGARVLLGSGNSTFSAWASFLGEMDTYSSAATPFRYAGLEDGRNGEKIVGIL